MLTSRTQVALLLLASSCAFGLASQAARAGATRENAIKAMPSRNTAHTHIILKKQTAKSGSDHVAASKNVATMSKDEDAHDKGAGPDLDESILDTIKEFKIRHPEYGTVEQSLSVAKRDHLPAAHMPRHDSTNGNAVAHTVQAKSLAAGATWQFIGPTNLITQSPNDTSAPYSGRADGVAYDPVVSGTYYIASGPGGVWKTQDSGVTWTNLSDTWSYPQANVVVLDPFNHNNVYVGTSDYDFGEGFSLGIRKSADGGATWSTLGSSIFTYGASSIAMDPDNANTLLAATYGTYLWRSTDGGNTWTQAVTPPSSAEGTSVAFGIADGSGNRNVYVCGFAASIPSTGTNALLYRSSDHGVTWTALTAPLVNSYQNALRIAPSAVDSNTLYLISGADRTIWKSTDAGNTWVNITANFVNGDGGVNWHQAAYDMFLKCAPGVDSTGAPIDYLYCGMIGVCQSLDGGSTWRDISGLFDFTGGKTHADQHGIDLDPTNPNAGLIVNDGGVYRFSYQPSSGTVSWTSLNKNLGLTQFYSAAWSPLNAAIITGGTQDNGTPYANGDLNNWTLFATGDGQATAIDPQNPLTQYACGTGSFYYIEPIYQTSNGWGTETTITPPVANEYQFVNAPVVLDPNNSNYLYFGSDYLWRWNKATNTWSGDLGGQQLSTTTWPITAISIAPGDSNRIYVGSDQQLWMTTDGGVTWSQIRQGATSIPQDFINSMAVNPQNENDLIVGSSNGLWRCTNTTLGSSLVWNSITGSGATRIPYSPVNSVAIDPFDPTNSTLYVANDVGVFMTTNGGGSWSNATAPLGLPNVQVNVLGAEPATGYLYAATFGRGMWRIGLNAVATPPAISGISPAGVSTGSSGLTLLVNGASFVAGCNVLWDGVPLSTTLVSSGQLSATVPGPYLAAQGTHSVTVYNPSNATSSATSSVFTVTPVDTTPPVTTASVSGTAGSNGWYTSSVTVTLSATDNQSGVAATYYNLDNGGQSAYSSPASISGDGTHTLSYWSVDQAGNTETAHTLTVKIDTTKPVLIFGAATPSPNAAGWHNTSISLPYTSSDATSGVASSTPGSPLSLSAQGASVTQTVTVTDAAGNTASFTSPTVEIDTTAPVSTGSASGAVVTLSATDSLSGVAVTYYTIDGGAQQTYSVPFTVVSGSHTVAYWSTDVAGNVETSHTLAVVVDTTPPVTTASVSGTTGSNGWYISAVTVTLSATDNLSGVATTYYKLDNGGQSVYSSPVSVSGDGTHTLSYWSKDNAGNTETAHTLTVKIDTTRPVLTFGTSTPSPNAAGWYKSAVTLPYTTSDATSGVASATPGSPLSIATQGSAVSQNVTVTDAAGNSAIFTSPVYKIDTTAPVTTGSASGALVTLSATDNRSGVAATYYTIDSGTQQTYSAPFTVTGAGSHTVKYWSADTAGNVESTHTLSVTGTTNTVTVTPSLASGSSNNWSEEDLRFSSTKSITALTVTITVQRSTGGPAYVGEYTNFPGSSVTMSYKQTGSSITYTYTLKTGQTLAAGTSYLTAAQFSGNGSTHTYTADTYNVQVTSGGVVQSYSGAM